MKRYTIFVLYVAFAMVGCTSGGTGGQGGILQGRPDLKIVSGWVGMKGYEGGCVEAIGPMESQVCVWNDGEVDLVDVEVQAGSTLLVFDDLPAGEEHCQMTGGAVMEAVADPNDKIAEADEQNNRYFFPIPTPPVICTPVP